MSGEADGTFIPFGDDHEMDIYGDTGNQISYSGEGVNKNEEQVFVSGILLPSGLDIKNYIQEDTNSVADELKKKCADLGYIPNSNDKNVCLLLTRTDLYGFLPKLTEAERPGKTYEPTETLLISRDKDYIVLFSRGKQNFYVEVSDFPYNGKRYNFKLETIDTEGNRVHGYLGFMRYGDIREVLDQREDLKGDLQKVVSSILKGRRILNMSS